VGRLSGNQTAGISSVIDTPSPIMGKVRRA
jgi:hypothetical protein